MQNMDVLLSFGGILNIPEYVSANMYLTIIYINTKRALLEVGKKTRAGTLPRG
jgi:hypothetical protein